MKTTLSLLAVLTVSTFAAPQPATTATPPPAASAAAALDGNTGFRLWHDTKGRAVMATFRGLEGDNVFIQTKDGYVYRIPLENLMPEDQQAAKTLKPEGLGIPADPNVAQAAARIDKLVLDQLTAKGEKPNALASDEQFVRRVYLDLVGRIPTREEVMEFLADTSSSKRAKVIDKLVKSEGFTSHLFNYFADMLRMTDTAQKAKFFTYEEWFKDQLAHNQPWDKIVYAMVSADGKLLENGAAGYLLRDKGMRLDNLSITLTSFLGANVACAQCHDHPFAEWSQKQFYEMAAFFGATETYDKKGGGYLSKDVQKSLTQEEMKRLKNILQVNGLSVRDTGKNEVKIPEDYKYKNASPGQIVAPKLVTWDMRGDPFWNPQAAIRLKKLYADVEASMASSAKPATAAKPVASANAKGKGKNASPGASASASASSGGTQEWRNTFAKWMVSPENPRFAMTIANRMWKNIFGVAVKEPISDLDDISTSNNPVLLYHLSHEMVRLKFDLRAFMRLLCNTQTYQREAITKQVTPGEPYYFPGPILRRMTAEQAWDSCVTLAIGEKVDGYKLRRADNYVAAMDLRPGMSASDVRVVLAGARGQGKGKPNKPAKNGKTPADNISEDGEVDHTRPEVLQGLVLARASELQQPEKDQHFLRMFGQSDRQVQDTNADEGSIPQVLMLMNGEAQKVLRNPKSRVLATAMGQKTPETQVESLYLSFFGRHPSKQEAAEATAALAGGMTVSDLTWVLFNAREFVFVQ